VKARSVISKAVVVISLLLIGVAVAQGSTLRVATIDDPTYLDPGVVDSYESGIVTYTVYEPLFRYDLNNYSVRPNLALSWESKNEGKEVTVHLRQGVIFQDGTTFDANAVKFTFERTLSINRTPAAYLQTVKDVRVDAPYTVTFVTEEPDAFLIDALASLEVLPIVSPTCVQAHATDEDPWAEEWMDGHAVCGTGPYMVEEWVHDQYVKLVAHEEYWGGWTDKNFDTVVIDIIKEPSKQQMMLKSGEIHAAYNIPSSILSEIALDPNIVVTSGNAMAQAFIPMKCHKGPLSNKALRQAITYAFDYEEALKVMPGTELAQGAIPKALPGFDEDLPVFRRDLDKARAFFAESGFAPGELSMEVVYNTGKEWKRMLCLLLKENLADLGIEITVRQMPWATLYPLMTDADNSPDMYVFYAAAAFADPYAILFKLFAPDAIGPEGFNNGYNNPKVGELLEQAKVTMDRQERANIYTEIQWLLIEDAPALFLFEQPSPRVHRAELKGVLPDSMFEFLYYYDLYLETSN